MVSIISPVHNEEAIVAIFVEKAVAFLHKKKIPGEVIIVENGSKDKTWEILNSLKKKSKELVVEKIPSGNKGLALKRGMEKAKGEFILTLDTDLWDEKFVQQSIDNLTKYDVVVGSKSISGAKDDRSLPSRLFNLGYNFMFRMIFNFKGTETHALLSFRRDKILPLVRQCKTGDLVFDTELILRAERAGLTKLEVPVVIKDVRARRYSMVKQLIKTVQNAWSLRTAIGLSPNWPYVLVFAALIVGAVLRFTNFSQWFFFSVDEEQYSFMTRMITVDRHFPLIGGPISGTKLYMAPWFLYFNAIWFWLSGNNPVFSGFVFATIELSVVILLYLIGKRLFSPMVGALGALLYAGSFLMALFDRHYWNITLVPFIATLTIYCLLRYFEGGKRWLVAASVVVSFGLSTTFSVFAVFLFVFLVLLLYRRSAIPVFLGIVALFHIPLIFFDLRHDFWLTKALWEFVTLRPETSIPLIVRVKDTAILFTQTLAKGLVITTPLNVSDETSICYIDARHYQSILGAQLLALLSLVVFVITFIKQRSRGLLLLFLLGLVDFLSLVIFRTDPSERHFLPFLPIFFLIFAYLLTKLRILGPILIVLVLGINFYAFSGSFATAGIDKKMALVEAISQQTQTGEFYLESVGTCHKWGYRYLFSQVGREPAASMWDDTFAWMYSQPPKPENAKVKVTIFNPTSYEITPR